MHIAVPVLTFALLVGCAAPGLGQPDDAPAPVDPTPTEEPGTDPTPVPPAEDNGPVTGETPADIVDRIISDAMTRTGASEDEIEVLRSEAVTWNDGSLGCPEPGMMYTQALVDGHHVVLRIGEAELDYRVAEGGHFILCEDPQDEDRPSS